VRLSDSALFFSLLRRWVVVPENILRKKVVDEVRETQSEALQEKREMWILTQGDREVLAFK